MLRVNAINRQGLLKCLTFNPKSLVFKTVSVPVTTSFPVTTFLSKKKEKNLAVLQKKRIFAAKKKQTSH